MLHALLKKLIYSRPIQEFRNFIKPLFRVFFKDLHTKTFRFNGSSYHYFTQGEYNNPWKNERAVEISIGIAYLKKYKEKHILEVGNVLSNYVPVTHDVLDPYDTEPFVIKEDIATYRSKKKYDLILCISTLEHIGWDMGDENGGIQPDKSIKAIKKMKSLLAPKGTLIVTTPFGYNPYLDERILNNKIPFLEKHYLKRTSIFNYWKEVKTFDTKDLQYDVIVMSPRLLHVGIMKNI